jgi:hypothetical protein
MAISKGRKIDRYVDEYGMPAERIATIDELVVGVKKIEDLLDDDALSRIQKELKLNELPSKGQIKRFFQERLATSNVDDLGDVFRTRATEVLNALSKKLIT